MDTKTANIDIREIEFSVRAANALDCHGIKTVEQLARMHRGELESWRNCGKTTIDEIESKLRELGGHFGMVDRDFERAKVIGGKFLSLYQRCDGLMVSMKIEDITSVVEHFEYFHDGKTEPCVYVRLKDGQMFDCRCSYETIESLMDSAK